MVLVVDRASVPNECKGHGYVSWRTDDIIFKTYYATKSSESDIGSSEECPNLINALLFPLDP